MVVSSKGNLLHVAVGESGFGLPFGDGRKIHRSPRAPLGIRLRFNLLE
jgi:hypothetical protein